MNRIAIGALVVALQTASTLAWSADPRSARPGAAYPPATTAPRLAPGMSSGHAPAVIAGYAALTDPSSGQRYVQRNGGAVGYGLSLQAVFRRDDGAPAYGDVCHYMCGVGVDDHGAPQPVNSAAITAYGYVVVFHADRSLTLEPQGAAGHGTYHGLPITGVITYNPDRYAFVELRARMRIDDEYRGTHQDVVMARRPPFDGLPDF